MDFARLTAKLPYFGWSQQQQSAWRGGLKTMSRSALAIFSWAVVTGLAMGKSSLSTEQALAMSLFVFAGSAQLAALPLIGAGFSVFTILITAFIVNLRFVIFSIGVQAHFSHLPAWRRAILGYFTADFGYLMYTSRFGEVQTEAERKNDSYYRTYFMYGQDGKDYIGNAMLFYNGSRLTPIYDSRTGAIYKRPEYAGMDLKDIDNFKV